MKIGIVTHYYNSTNYGGNLQAYALCRYVNGMENCQAEQISVNTKSNKSRGAGYYIKHYGVIGCVGKFAARALKSIRMKVKHKKYALAAKNLRTRKDAILPFNLSIPHSSQVYTLSDISNANRDYDFFITGSDQVWHPNAWNTAYRLDFVADDKKKLSYAASISKGKLTVEETAVLKKSLSDYIAISVRERDALSLVSDISPVKPKWVMDPVFLLSAAQWIEASDDRILPSEKYVFCYFLGDSKKERKAAIRYASARGLKIVTLPFLSGEYRTCDDKFGDYNFFDVSPSQFVSLLRHAHTVFTDSFHALAFSIIFNKEVFVFERSGAREMSTRIVSILSLVNAEKHFCDKGARLSDFLNLEPIDYSAANNNIENMISSSKEFLEENLR